MVRKVAAKDSEKIGTIPLGEVIICIATQDIDGTPQVQFDHKGLKIGGWTSVTASNGAKLLEEVPAGTKAAGKNEKKKDEKKKKPETPKKPRLSAVEQAALDKSQTSFDCVKVSGVKGVKGACKVKIGQINIQTMSADGMKPLGSWVR